ncbi:hypothetical protein A1O7_07025 [Cladophialophora yegresii CBS 114405]|uniref:Uncharacterized protein n=1 Tax=Cladophialophora yegresii CBS 114405 TaxID=1182544 RepID=W9VWS7_9EURO|nr:uncharacterized protein A1O7_07025 [Cladophialophora yegresii CBS 114405]EXJ56681.1 hypothetical protein A1O7_07025 [Cladophialophora yegresii CBS 114405]
MDSSQDDSGLEITGGGSVSVEVPKQRMVRLEEDPNVVHTIPRLAESGFKTRSTRQGRLSGNPNSLSTDAVPVVESDISAKSNDSQQFDDDSEHDDYSPRQTPAERQTPEEITPASSKRGRRRGKTGKTNNKVKQTRPLRLNLEQSHTRIRLQMNAIETYKQAKIKQLEKRMALEQTARSLKEENSKLAQDVQGLKHQISEHEATIQGYHDDALELLGKDKAEAMQDEQVTEDLTWLFSETKEWARTWSIERWNDAAKAKVRDLLAIHAGKAFATKWLVAAIDRAAQDKQTPPQMVLNALLNCFLCDETFRRPFAHLGRSMQDAANDSYEDCMNWVMEAATEECPEGCNKLRARICSLVDKPAVLDGSKAAKLSSRQKDMQCLRQHRCEKIVALCLSKFHVGLQAVGDEDGQKRHKEMLEIVEAALRLSARLSTENPEVRFYFLDDLEKTKFDLRHDRFKPHRILKLDDEEFDDEAQRAEAEALVGRPFDMVVEPCVVRRGDAKGQEYEKEQVLYRGVVWMVKGMVIPPEELSEDEASSNDQYSMQATSAAGPGRGGGNGISAASRLHLGDGVRGEPNESGPPGDRAGSYQLRFAPKPPSKLGFEDDNKNSGGKKKLVGRNISASGTADGQIPSTSTRRSHEISAQPLIARHDSLSTEPFDDGTTLTSEAPLSKSRTSTPSTDSRKKRESASKRHRGTIESLERQASRQQANDLDNNAELQVEGHMLYGGADTVRAARILKEEAPVGPEPELCSGVSRKRKISDNSTKVQARDPDHVESYLPSKKMKTNVASESNYHGSAGDDEDYVSITQLSADGYCEHFSSTHRSNPAVQQEVTAKLTEGRSIERPSVTDGSSTSFDKDGLSIIDQEHAVQVSQAPGSATEVGEASDTWAERPSTTPQRDHEPTVLCGRSECTSERGCEISNQETIRSPERQARSNGQASSNEQPNSNQEASASAVTVNENSPLD